MAESYVGKPCPKCRYVRTAADTSPDWQCPKCGVAYAKFVQSQQAASAAGSAVATPTRQPLSAAGARALGNSGLAMFAHLSILIGGIVPLFGIIVPIVLWITKSGKDQLVVANAKEAINFQISVLLWLVVLVGITFAAPASPKVVWVVAGLVVVLVIACVVLPIVAAVKANGGEEYRYPFTAHIFS